MKVLLISANASTSPHPVYPLGLDHVAAAVRDSHRVEIVDACVPGVDVRSRIEEFSPDVVGISIRNIDSSDRSEPTSFLDDYRELVRTVRATANVPIVLGGAGFTIFPQELMQDLGAEYGIVGEGERLGGLLDALENGDTAAGLPGVVLPSGPTSLPEPWKGPIQNTFSARGDHLEFYLRKGGILNFQTKRGCPFHCIYCTYPLIEGAAMRLFDPAEVGQRARALQDAGAKFLFVTDAVFNSNAEHSLAVARSMREAGVSIPWGAFFSPIRPSDRYYARMADCGLTHVEFGTDTLSESMLAAYRKPFCVRDVEQAHGQALDAGLHVAHYLALGGPGESLETLTETLGHAEKLKKSVFFFFAGLRVFPHTALWRTAVAEGRIARDQNLLEPCFYSPETLDLDRMLDEVSRRAQGRNDWVVGAGGERMAKVVSRFYDRGYTGPLWEKLIA